MMLNFLAVNTSTECGGQPTTCNPCKPVTKILKTGTSLEVQKVVRTIAVAGSSLHVTNTDGSTYALELPKSAPANINEVNILNASGTHTVATVATLK